VLLINHGPEIFKVTRGMRIAQLVIAAVVRIQLNERDKLEQTKRGSGGFGSTGTC
jgi:dUTP pyrophosphatase